jgi:hypothetical protein
MILSYPVPLREVPLALNKTRTMWLMFDGHKDKQDSVDIKG